MLSVFIGKLSQYKEWDEKRVFNNKSVELPKKGNDILQISAANIFLAQKLRDFSIICFVSMVEEPDVDSKLDCLDADAEQNGH